MVPFFPVEAASRGVSQTLISAVFSCFAVAQMIASPLVGRLGPVVGVTRLYNIGIATAGLTTITFGTLNYIHGKNAFVVACFLVRLVEAVGTAAVSGCAFTIIGLYAVAGFGMPFYVLGGTMVGAALLNQWMMPPLVKCERNAVPFLSMLRVFARSFKNWLCLMIVFLYSFVFITFESCMALYANKVLGVTPSTLGLYFLVATTVYALTSFMWARLSEHSRNPYVQMSLCLLATTGSLLLIAPSPLLNTAPRWWLLGLGQTLLEGFFGGAYIPCFSQMLQESVRKGLADDLVTQAFVSSVYWTGYSLGSVVGPVSGGLLVDAYGFPVMMTCMAGLALLVWLLTVMQAVGTACSEGRRCPSGNETEPLCRA
ncbi:MFS-type transporter SLC18B1-like [Pollicipes pollicipes]|uniref:MFS-type transporter SLC18B1-like n=1 Tax=Pollicipes pollicipes TaxID=41117 RepID=UPI001884C429|nr:MFS-type transporter SLC18B1-like [Pollicipes pollicipes]